MKKKEQKEKAQEREVLEKQGTMDEKEQEIIIEHNVELEEYKKKAKEYFELAQRTMADFDNYKKRTVKEKELLYTDAVVNVISKILPVLDNLEKASGHTDDKNDNPLAEGIKMVIKQFKEMLSSMGVEEIKAIGEKFDPLYHFAVMHVSDDNYAENEIAEELQKGYIINDRVIRHSMVKVAN